MGRGELVKKRSFSEKLGPAGSNIIKARRASQEREQVTRSCARELEMMRTKVMLELRRRAEEGSERDVT